MNDEKCAARVRVRIQRTWPTKHILRHCEKKPVRELDGKRYCEQHARMIERGDYPTL